MKFEICECGLFGTVTERQVLELIAEKEKKNGGVWDWIQCPTGSFLYHAFDHQKKSRLLFTEMIMSGRCKEMMKMKPFRKSISFGNGSYCWYASKAELDEIYDKIAAEYIRSELEIAS